MPTTLAPLMLALVIIFATGALLAAAGTGIVRSYAISRSLLDVPSPRSSHSRPTPRGGGLALVVVSLAGMIAALAADVIHTREAAALIGGGIAIAVVGWLDDRYNLAPGGRAVVHFGAAIWAVACLGGVNALQLGPLRVGLQYFGSVLAVLTIVWLTNLYNFMDGIDGIAGGNALVVAMCGSLFFIHDGNPGLAMVAMQIAGASMGFLVWNWPPARVFMGDVGSGFLGYTFAVLALVSEQQAGAGLVIWFLLLGVFIFDATVTLARRVLRGESWYKPHRNHAYQRLVQAGHSHAEVTIWMLVLDACFAAGALAVRLAGAPMVCVLFGSTTILVALYFAIERRNPMSQRDDVSAVAK